MTPPVRVADASDPASAEREAFHAVVPPVYAGEPAGTAPNPVVVERGLIRPQFASRQRVLVTLRGAEPVARVVARVSPALRDAGGDAVGMLGFFEARDDATATSTLLREACHWLRTQGAGQIVGPMDGDTWHRYRVNVGPFDDLPFPLEPWNPGYYEALWVRAGFRPVESYSSKWIDDVSTLLPALAPGVERAQSRGVGIRELDRARIPEELSTIHDLSSRIFADAFLYSPVSRAEFLTLYAGIERYLDPALVLFAETADGIPVGFVFAYADPSRPAVHYKTIGVLAEWRRAAVAALLSDAVYNNALRQRRPQGNHALMRDDNRSQALDQGQGRVFRRYVLYELERDR